MLKWKSHLVVLAVTAAVFAVSFGFNHSWLLFNHSW